MTTQVTVNAYHGCPVLVTLKHGEPNCAKSVSSERIEPMTEKHYFIHSGLQIMGIEEMPLPAAT